MKQRLIDADDVTENLMNSNWFDCDDIDVALQAVKLTDTIDALKAGKVLFSVDEYGFFIAYQKKED